MNVAREFSKLIDNFTSGLACLQAYNPPGQNHVTIEDGDLIWVKTPSYISRCDARDLMRKGWEVAEDDLSWSFRLMIPTTPCADRIKTEREIEELHAQF